MPKIKLDKHFAYMQESLIKNMGYENVKELQESIDNMFIVARLMGYNVIDLEDNFSLTYIISKGEGISYHFIFYAHKSKDYFLINSVDYEVQIPSGYKSNESNNHDERLFNRIINML